MAFLDEAGIGAAKDDPHLIVAGVIVHADKQWKAIERRLEELWYEYMPPDAPSGYPFHAMELFSGGRVFRREHYNREYRWSILEKIVSIPAEFDLPVVGVAMRRKPDDNDHWVKTYRWGYVHAMTVLEAYMRLLPDRDEVANVIVEDNPEIRQHVRDAQNQLQDARTLNSFHAHDRDRLWLTRVIGRPHFEDKSAISVLQVADACAFVFRRMMLGKDDVESFVRKLLPQSISIEQPWLVNADGERRT